MFDGKAFGAEIVGVVKDYVGRTLEPLIRRLEALESRPAPTMALAGLVIDRSGNLVAPLADGTVRDLGPVVGKDGAPGADGVGFDDLSFEHDGERGFTLRFIRGDQTKEFAFTIPVVLDRGVFQKDATYQKGDAVSWGGSLWIAQADTGSAPGDGADWRLAVKKGRDGKTGDPGKDARVIAKEGKS